MERKVLFIAYLFPPISNSGTQRSVKFSKYLPLHGWEPIVLTVQNPPETTLNDELLNEVGENLTVVRVPYKSKVVADKIAKLMPKGRLRERLADALEWRIRAKGKGADPQCMWFDTAVNKGVELVEELDIDVIYASGNPWTSFLIAQKISALTKKPFVLDYRDLWTNVETGWVAKSQEQEAFSQRLEAQAIENASAIITVTDRFVDQLKKACIPQYTGPIHCIENGYDETEFDLSSKSNKSPDRVTIGYTGVWKKGYGPEYLYNALSNIAATRPDIATKLSLLTAGFPPKAQNYELNGIEVCEQGPVSHKKAIETMLQSNVLFLPVAEGFYAQTSLPGKLFEYVASQTPILAAARRDSQVNEKLEKIGYYCLVEPRDATALEAKIVAVVEKGVGAVFNERDTNESERFERKALTAMLANVLNSVC